MIFSRFKKIKPVERNFNPSFLLNQVAQKQLETEGFVLLKNIVNEDELNEIQQFYHSIKQNEAFKVEYIFRSTGNFKSQQLQQEVFSFINAIMQKIAPRIANLQHCEIGNGGAFFIKPNSDNSQLEPHQDSTVIDETKGYALFVWMPLQNITLENGPLFVLPKSHLWGNYFRSQHIPWAFRKNYKFLWQFMQPILANRGDVIVFDASLIHGSTINTTNEHRIAMCGALLPKNYQMVDYLLQKQTIQQYQIDNQYWIDGGLPELLTRYKSIQYEYTFPNPISKQTIKNLVNFQKQEV